jgi:hypothetical protein
MRDFEDFSPIMNQMEYMHDIVASLVKVWAQSEAGTMRISQIPTEDALRGMRYEIDRICNKFSKFSPAEIASAIRQAANDALDSNYPRLTIRGIETEVQLIERKRKPLALPVHANKWSGTPSEALDRNWPEIWEKSVLESINKGEKRRLFDHDYLQVWENESDKAAARIRDLAFIELKRRVYNSPEFNPDTARQMVREGLFGLLMACYPRYKYEIDSGIWATEYDDLNALCQTIHGLEANNRGAGKFQQVPNVSKVEWMVFFDLYAKFNGHQWPELKATAAPKNQEIKPKPRWMSVPKDLDSMNT